MRRPKALLGAHRLDQPVDEQSHGHARSYFLLCAALFALRFQAWCCESLLDLKQTRLIFCVNWQPVIWPNRGSPSLIPSSTEREIGGAALGICYRIVAIRVGRYRLATPSRRSTFFDCSPTFIDGIDGRQPLGVLISLAHILVLQAREAFPVAENDYFRPNIVTHVGSCKLHVAILPQFGSRSIVERLAKPLRLGFAFIQSSNCPVGADGNRLRQAEISASLQRLPRAATVLRTPTLRNA